MPDAIWISFLAVLGVLIFAPPIYREFMFLRGVWRLAHMCRPERVVELEPSDDPDIAAEGW